MHKGVAFGGQSVLKPEVKRLEIEVSEKSSSE
jgi:hypothetical protein